MGYPLSPKRLSTSKNGKTFKKYLTIKICLKAWHHRFSHLVGYGAKYYSYLLSRGVAAWIWQQYFQEDPFSRESGERFRQGFLAHGGSKPPRDMVAAFLGKDVNPSTLTSSLVRELDAKQETLMAHLYKK